MAATQIDFIFSSQGAPGRPIHSGGCSGLPMLRAQIRATRTSPSITSVG
ncbi:hypothetical protein RHECNPAF_4310048 [Rhizobium etli CNPAF512]|nr:hypothetical protein RHECNPAF_4310048 [Rhizobium etli CNPAF512]